MIYRTRMATSNGPELVIGLVSAVGTNTKIVCDAVKESLSKVNYTTEHIRIIEKLKELDRWRTVADFPSEDARYNALMDAGNAFRSDMKCNEALAMLSVAYIRNARFLHTGSRAKPNVGTAYLVHSLKNPDEVQTLRRIYGRNFIAIGAYSPERDRVPRLIELIRQSHGGGHREEFDVLARQLVMRDKAESNLDFGQNVREAYPLADFFINAENPTLVGTEVKRAIELFFGNSQHTATREEYGMFNAFSASLRSASLARQVGAAICRPEKEGQVIALGCNDVPKNGGGLYWENDSPDYRDHAPDVGYDTNDKMKANLVRDVLKRLKNKKWLNEELSLLSVQELVQRALQNNDAPLRDAMLMDIIDYGRAVHAEMDAITDAARRGVSLQGCVLYTTTFPCHNCAKHILAAGIDKVIYIEPYHKSYALDMYSGCIIADSPASSSTGIPFQSFVGIAPRQYIRLYSMGDSVRKDNKGDAVKWDPATALPREPETASTYLLHEDECIKDLQSKLNLAGIHSVTPDTML